ncbi:MAG: cell division protein FtsZ [Promethearchaeota archaeon]
MASGLEDLIGKEKLKELIGDEIITDTINGLPVVKNGQVVLKKRFYEDFTESDNNQDGPEIIGDSDEYLSDLLHQLKTRTVVIGVGGAGNNAISRLQETGTSGAVTMAINTDAQDLFYANSDKKYLIGKEITDGLGAGNNPELGEKAAESDVEKLKKITEKNIVFITCGLGGGTGTGAAPVIAREAKKAGALVISFCTLPFKMEGEYKKHIANEGLLKLAEFSDTIIPLPNERLMKLVPNLTLMKGFKIMDEILIRSVKGIVDLVSNCGLINLDLADVKNILSKREEYTGVIGMSEILLDDLIKKNTVGEDASFLTQKLKERTLKALQNPLLTINPKDIQSCLVSITGNQNLSLSQVNEIVSTVSENISPRANLKFGAMVDPSAKSIKINIIGLGPKSLYLKEAEKDTNDNTLKTVIEFVS